MTNKKRLGLAGLLLVGAASVFAANNSPTEKYLLDKSTELGLDYQGWLSSLSAKDQEVFTTFANDLIKVVDGLPINYKAYAQGKFEKLLKTGDEKGIYAEIKQDVLNASVAGDLAGSLRMLDSYLKDNADSVERISSSLKAKMY